MARHSRHNLRSGFPVAIAAVEISLDVAGYTHQAGFLLSLGITEEVARESDFKKNLTFKRTVKAFNLTARHGRSF